MNAGCWLSSSTSRVPCPGNAAIHSGLAFPLYLTMIWWLRIQFNGFSICAAETLILKKKVHFQGGVNWGTECLKILIKLIQINSSICIPLQIIRLTSSIHSLQNKTMCLLQMSLQPTGDTWGKSIDPDNMISYKHFWLNIFSVRLSSSQVCLLLTHGRRIAGPCCSMWQNHAHENLKRTKICRHGHGAWHTKATFTSWATPASHSLCETPNNWMLSRS